MEETRIIVLSGPTASGKSGAALSLGRRFPLEIINADALQVYRGMDIGTSKPSREDRLAVPHHLIDVADPDENYNAGRFVADAEGAIRAIRSRGRVPLVTGGTGMYIRALLRGLDPLPSDPQIRAELGRRWTQEGGASLYAELAKTDPGSASGLHPSDRVRVLRALEIAALTGKPASAQRTMWAGDAGRYRVLFLALSWERAELYRRIDGRVDDMFRRGLVDEVRELLSRGYGPGLKAMGALGYRHVCSHLAGKTTLPQAVVETKRDTRRYAKRQLTWLSREPGAVWIAAEQAFERAHPLVKKFLF